MIRVSALLLSLFLSGAVWSYGSYNRSVNPLTNGNYGVARAPVTIQSASSGLSNILPANNFGVVGTNNRASTIQTTTTTTQVNAPAVSAPSVGHTHPIPNFAPAPAPAPSFAHAHLGQNPAPPVPAPGMPHMHSGHPYIAPAVAPQRMTYQQIIEYLANTNGVNLSTTLRNGSGNFLAQCKAYCDTLPPNPTCDSSNVLYRNECEAKCVHKTVSTSTLRYGMCCCSDDDYNYATAGNVFFSSTTGTNLCFSTCIFNCLGGETPIEAQHQSDNLVVALARSSTSCANIS